jgi:TRAP-type uncharacterized transport system substrate-binding protein
MVTKKYTIGLCTIICAILVANVVWAGKSSYTSSRSTTKSSFSTYKPSKSSYTAPKAAFSDAKPSKSTFGSGTTKQSDSGPKAAFADSKPSKNLFGSSNTQFNSKPEPKPIFGSNKPSISNDPPTRQVVNKQSANVAQPKTFGAQAGQQQKIAASKQAYIAQQQSTFKPRPVAATQPTNTIGSRSTPTSTVNNTTAANTANYRRTYYNPNTISRASSYNHTTYYSRRSSYYNNWNPPVYVHNSYSSFGMWDSMALWFMLDHINDNRYRDMYYHQQNNQGMQEWRAEANNLAKDNAELKAKLDALDQKVAAQKTAGVTVDPNFTPADVDTDVLMSQEAIKDISPKLTMCSGRNGRLYSSYTNGLADSLDSVDVTNQSTAGSVQNLKMLDEKQCDAAIVQRDTYITYGDDHPDSALNYERVTSPYSEVVSLVCHKDSGIENFTDIKPSTTIDIGEAGSGSENTWNVLKKAQPSLVKNVVQHNGGQVAALNMAHKTVNCMLTVSGLNSQVMRNLVAESKGNFEIVEWNSDVLDSVVDPAGEKVYSHHTLPSHSYEGLQSDNKLGWFQVDTDVIMVPADVIVSNDWKNKNSKIYNDFAQELANNSVSTTRANYVQ